jgi:hypothetical protein
VNLITDTPAFQISGNETYTTKGATADTSNTQTPIVTNIQFVQKTALDTLVTGTSPSGATSGSQNNPYLAFSYNPILTDIRGAVDLGGSAGSALPNVQWDDIDIVINLTDKTATLTAKLTSLQYTGTVVLYYTTQN